MNRKLLLISNPGVVGRNYVAHVPNILARYKDFFKSPVGGYWSDEEIMELPNDIQNPAAQATTLALMINDCNKNYDYSMIVFVGHGASYLGNDIVQLSGGELCPVNCLAPIGYETTIKRTVIIDACRSLIGTTQQQLLLEQRTFSGEGQLLGSYCKDYYNSIIKQSVPHIELIQSTKYGEPALVTLDGSAFSDSLFDVLNQNVKNWNAFAMSTHDGHFSKSTHEIIDMTKAKMGVFNQVSQ